MRSTVKELKTIIKDILVEEMATMNDVRAVLKRNPDATVPDIADALGITEQDAATKLEKIAVHSDKYSKGGKARIEKSAPVDDQPIGELEAAPDETSLIEKPSFIDVDGFFNDLKNEIYSNIKNGERDSGMSYDRRFYNWLKEQIPEGIELRDASLRAKPSTEKHGKTGRGTKANVGYFSMYNPENNKKTYGFIDLIIKPSIRDSYFQFSAEDETGLNNIFNRKLKVVIGTPEDPQNLKNIMKLVKKPKNKHERAALLDVLIKGNLEALDPSRTSYSTYTKSFAQHAVGNNTAKGAALIGKTPENPSARLKQIGAVKGKSYGPAELYTIPQFGITFFLDEYNPYSSNYRLFLLY